MKRTMLAVAMAMLFGCGSERPEAREVLRSATAGTGCGEKVRRVASVWRVSPSGGEDTTALQCAIDEAIAAGPGTTIELQPGTFQTAQLVATGFDGALRGHGASVTVITNIDRPLPVTMPYLEVHPTPERPAAVLLTFVNANVTVADLAVVLRGEAPVEAWTVFGLDPLHVFNSAIMVLGDHATAVFERIRVEGAPSPELFGMNTINGIYFEGFVPMSDPQALGGRFELTDSVVRGVASGAPVFNLRDADVVISGNVFEGVLFGSEAAALEGGSYLFAGNRVSASWYGFAGYDLCLSGSQANCATTGTRLHFSGNTIDSGFVGLSLLGTLDDETECLLAGNRLSIPEEGLALELGETAQARCAVRSTLPR